MSEYQSIYARPVAEASVETRLGFLRRVYGWMTAALALTGVGAAVSIQSGLTTQLLLRGGFVSSIIVFVAWIGLAYLVQRVRHTPVVNVIAFGAYAAFTGFVISSLVLIAMFFAQAGGHDSMHYVWQALGLTAITFGGLTVYTFFTKRDFSFLSGILFVGLLALIGLGIINIFVQSSVFALGISFLGVLIFCGYILYDTQKIMREYPANEHVAGAMQLFLNFVLLFTHILRILLLLASGNRD